MAKKAGPKLAPLGAAVGAATVTAAAPEVATGATTALFGA